MTDPRFNSYILRHKGLLRVVTVITLWSFLFSVGGGEYLAENAWAATAQPEPTRVGSDAVGSPIYFKELNVETFNLPQNLGHIKDSWFNHVIEKSDIPLSLRGRQSRPKQSQPIVIHIQDAHCNYGAQHKVADIIEYLNKEYGIDTVNLEGGVGEYDLSAYTGIEEQSIRKDVADYFVKKGYLSGAEYFAINNPDKVELWGVEDTELYLENLNIYRDSLKEKETTDNYLKELDHILTNLKRHIYTKELLDLDRKYGQYKAEAIEFKEYLTYLTKSAKDKALDIKSFSNLYLLNQALGREESIDFKLANIERNRLIEEFEKMLSKTILIEMVEKTVQFKKEMISQKDYYEYLFALAEKIKLNLDKYPNLKKYMVYIRTYEAIDKLRIQKELSALESAIKETLYKNNEQRTLDTLSKNLILTKNIFNISLSNEDYEYYKNNEDSFGIRNYKSFIGKQAPLYKIQATLDDNIDNLDIYRKNMVRFYQCSKERDEAFLRNMVITNSAKTYPQSRGGLNLPYFVDKSRAPGPGPRLTILITGGFHTDNLCELLKKNDISYISIMPNFKNHKDYESPYFTLLQEEINPIHWMMYDALWPVSPEPGRPAANVPNRPGVEQALAIASLETVLGKEVWNEQNFIAYKAWIWLMAEAKRNGWDPGSIKITPAKDAAYMVIQVNINGQDKIILKLKEEMLAQAEDMEEYLSFKKESPRYGAPLTEEELRKAPHHRILALFAQVAKGEKSWEDVISLIMLILATTDDSDRAFKIRLWRYLYSAQAHSVLNQYGFLAGIAALWQTSGESISPKFDTEDSSAQVPAPRLTDEESPQKSKDGFTREGIFYSITSFVAIHTLFMLFLTRLGHMSLYNVALASTMATALVFTTAIVAYLGFIYLKSDTHKRKTFGLVLMKIAAVGFFIGITHIPTGFTYSSTTSPTYEKAPIVAKPLIFVNYGTVRKVPYEEEQYDDLVTEITKVVAGENMRELGKTKTEEEFNEIVDFIVWIMINRATSGRAEFGGDTIEEVIAHPTAFSCIKDLKSVYHKRNIAKLPRRLRDTANSRKAKIRTRVEEVLRGEVADPTNGGVLYYNPDIVTDPWKMNLLEETVPYRIGGHRIMAYVSSIIIMLFMFGGVAFAGTPDIVSSTTEIINDVNLWASIGAAATTVAFQLSGILIGLGLRRKYAGSPESRSEEVDRRDFTEEELTTDIISRFYAIKLAPTKDFEVKDGYFIVIDELVPGETNQWDSERQEFTEPHNFVAGQTYAYIGPIVVIHGNTLNGRIYIGDKPANEIINKIAREKGLKKLLLLACNPCNGELGPTDIPVIYSSGITKIQADGFSAFGKWKTNLEGKSVKEITQLGGVFGSVIDKSYTTPAVGSASSEGSEQGGFFTAFPVISAVISASTYSLGNLDAGFSALTVAILATLVITIVVHEFMHIVTARRQGADVTWGFSRGMPAPIIGFEPGTENLRTKTLKTLLAPYPVHIVLGIAGFASLVLLNPASAGVGLFLTIFSWVNIIAGASFGLPFDTDGINIVKILFSKSFQEKMEQENRVNAKEFAAKLGYNETETIDMSMPEDELKKQVVAAVREKKALILDLSRMPREINEENYKEMARKFLTVALSISSAFSHEDINWITQIVEPLKNAFCHGNKFNYDLPIIMQVDLDDKGVLRKIEVSDIAAPGRASRNVIRAARRARIMGLGLGAIMTLGIGGQKFSYDMQHRINQNGNVVGTSVYVEHNPDGNAKPRDEHTGKEAIVSASTEEQQPSSMSATKASTEVAAVGVMVSMAAGGQEALQNRVDVVAGPMPAPIVSQYDALEQFEDSSRQAVNSLKRSVSEAKDSDAVDRALLDFAISAQARMDRMKDSPGEDLRRIMYPLYKEMHEFFLQHGYTFMENPNAREDKKALILYKVMGDGKPEQVDAEMGPVDVYYVEEVTQFPDNKVRSAPAWSSTFSDEIVICASTVRVLARRSQEMLQGKWPFRAETSDDSKNVILNNLAYAIIALTHKGLDGKTEEEIIYAMQESARNHEIEHKVRKRMLEKSEKDGFAINMTLDEQLAELKSLINSQEPWHVLAHIIDLATSEITQDYEGYAVEMLRDLTGEKDMMKIIRALNLFLASKDAEGLRDAARKAYQKAEEKWNEEHPTAAALLGLSLVGAILPKPKQKREPDPETPLEAIRTLDRLFSEGLEAIRTKDLDFLCDKIIPEIIYLTKDSKAARDEKSALWPIYGTFKIPPHEMKIDLKIDLMNRFMVVVLSKNSNDRAQPSVSKLNSLKEAVEDLRKSLLNAKKITAKIVEHNMENIPVKDGIIDVERVMAEDAEDNIRARQLKELKDIIDKNDVYSRAVASISVKMGPDGKPLFQLVFNRGRNDKSPKETPVRQEGLLEFKEVEPAIEVYVKENGLPRDLPEWYGKMKQEEEILSKNLKKAILEAKVVNNRCSIDFTVSKSGELVAIGKAREAGDNIVVSLNVMAENTKTPGAIEFYNNKRAKQLNGNALEEIKQLVMRHNLRMAKEQGEPTISVGDVFIQVFSGAKNEVIEIIGEDGNTKKMTRQTYKGRESIKPFEQEYFISNTKLGRLVHESISRITHEEVIIEAANAVNRRGDLVITVAGISGDITEKAGFEETRNEVDDILGRAGYGVRGTRKLVTFDISDPDSYWKAMKYAQDSIDEYKTELNRLQQRLDNGEQGSIEQRADELRDILENARIVAFTPAGAQLASQANVEYEEQKHITIIADSYQDAKYPDHSSRRALAHLIAYQLNSGDTSAFDSIKTLLNRVSDNTIDSESLSDLLEHLFAKPLKIKSIFQSIRQWQVSQEAVAVAL